MEMVAKAKDGWSLFDGLCFSGGNTRIFLFGSKGKKIKSVTIISLELGCQHFACVCGNTLIFALVQHQTERIKYVAIILCQLLSLNVQIMGFLTLNFLLSAHNLTSSIVSCCYMRWRGKSGGRKKRKKKKERKYKKKILRQFFNSSIIDKST